MFWSVQMPKRNFRVIGFLLRCASPPRLQRMVDSCRGAPHLGVTTLKMPQLGESVTEGTVDHWLKQEGEFVRRDEPIVEVVTDKVNAEVPSPVEGRLVRIQVQSGQTVPIGTALAELEVEGAAPAAKPEPPAAPPPAPAPRPTPPAQNAGRVSPG